ncbi:MAG: 23S rRNA (pseudouridine(1915)-N(3))-methyltransferase RlmH [Solobacterium sp.]|nr:23S rRNA (pseudouridine(1915)-N(3))-methyltransferase RlmH [Solobacterium sp.]
MIRILSAGKVRDAWLRQGIQEYAKRIQPYEAIELIEVKDEKAPESNSDAENEAVKDIEAERILKQIKDGDYVILLDLAGRPIDSVSLSKKIAAVHTAGKNRIDFVIGGSLGVGRSLQKRADTSWKLSDNTFPHQLCRLIVLEQIYRAFRILNHEPYHK